MLKASPFACFIADTAVSERPVVTMPVFAEKSSASGALS
jgi:hypothetical protein